MAAESLIDVRKTRRAGRVHSPPAESTSNRYHPPEQPFETIHRSVSELFLADKIISPIEVDRADSTKLTQQVYIGEVDLLERASQSPFAAG
jgi:hypothetical protein